MDDTATPTRWRIRSLISAAASAKESRCRPWEQWENLRPVTHQRPHRRTVIARLDGQHGAGDLFSVGHLHSTAASSVDGRSGLTVSRLVHCTFLGYRKVYAAKTGCPVVCLLLPERSTRNHAAYSAGTKKIVSNVATVSPPMIAIAIGPQNTLRVSGTIASTVAAAVSIT